MLFQTVHRHPIAGGFVARLPLQVRQRYADDQTLSALVELSGHLYRLDEMGSGVIC